MSLRTRGAVSRGHWCRPPLQPMMDVRCRDPAGPDRDLCLCPGRCHRVAERGEGMELGLGLWSRDVTFTWRPATGVWAEYRNSAATHTAGRPCTTSHASHWSRFINATDRTSASTAIPNPCSLYDPLSLSLSLSVCVCVCVCVHCALRLVDIPSLCFFICLTVSVCLYVCLSLCSVNQHANISLNNPGFPLSFTNYLLVSLHLRHGTKLLFTTGNKTLALHSKR